MKRGRSNSFSGAIVPRRGASTASGSRSRRMQLLRNVSTQIHAFKRLGTPFHITNDVTTPWPPTGAGPTPLVNGVAAGTNLSLQLGNLSVGNVTYTQQFGASMHFKLSDVAENTDITGLFDNYRIVSVKLRFDYSWNQAPGQVTNTGGSITNSASLPLMHIAYDCDDDTIPTSVNQVVANSYCKTHRLDNTVKFTIKPRAQNVVAVSPVTGTNPVIGNTVSGGLLPSSTWLDTGNAAVRHYGMKMWFDNVPLQGLAKVWCLTVTPIYYLEAKNVN